MINYEMIHIFNNQCMYLLSVKRKSHCYHYHQQQQKIQSAPLECFLSHEDFWFYENSSFLCIIWTRRLCYSMCNTQSYTRVHGLSVCFPFRTVISLNPKTVPL